jgi:two-component system, LytTR family, sensor kinase
MPPTGTEEQRNQLWLETAVILAAWTLFGLLMTNQFYLQSSMRGDAMTWGRVLKPSLFEAYLWATVTLVIFWLTRRFPLERGRMLRGVPVHLVAAVTLAVARVAAMVEMSRYVDWLGARTYERQFFSWFHTYFLFCVLIAGIAHAVLYYRRYRERERTAERLAAGLAEARLQALKLQLQPHFLFNTLNAISALIPAEAKPARRMVARLGDLLRMSLEHEETQEVTLSEELGFLEPYLEIEQARMGERLTVVMQIDPDTLDARVPHLMLQPLVENAIRHGIAPRIEPGRVEITTARSADHRFLELEVRDNGRGVQQDSHAGTRKRVGLSNIQSRLEELYRGEQRFELENHTGGGASVRISLPYRRGDAVAGMKESAVG